MEVEGVELKTVDARTRDSETTILTLSGCDCLLTLYQYSLPRLSRRSKSALLADLCRITDFVHAHIARIFKVWSEKEKLYVLQEKLHGDSLAHVIERQYRKKLHFSEPQAWRTLYEMCISVDFLHKVGLPFVELSQEAVRYTQEGRVTLETWHEVLLKTKIDTSGHPPATSLLKSPEEVYEQKRNKQSDVWSLGFLLYQYLTFGSPYGMEKWPQAEEAKELQVAPLPPCYSGKLNALVLRMLYKHPENRPTISQIISEIPLGIKIRYVKPSPSKNLSEMLPKPPQKEELKREMNESIQSALQLRAPFRRLEVRPRTNETARTGKSSGFPREMQWRRTNLRPNTNSPVKRTIGSSKTATGNVTIADGNFLSKTQTRGSSRLSSHESLNLSYERITKRTSNSRPTIETLGQY